MDLIMKSHKEMYQSLLSRYDEQQARCKRKNFSKRGWLTGISIAASMLVCSTLTVGAINNWDYAAVFRKYFSEKSDKEISYDFSDMGIDINETYKQNGYELRLGSVIADANSLYISYHFRLDEEYESQLPQTGEQIYGRLLPEIHLKDADGAYINEGITVSKITKQNEDGSFDCAARHSLADCYDYSDKTLVIDIDVPAYAGTFSYMENPNISMEGVHTPMPTSSERHMYSLNGITNVKGAAVNDGIQLTDGSDSAFFDSVTVSPLGITFLRYDIQITPAKSTDPDVKIGRGTYGYEFTAPIGSNDSDHPKSDTDDEFWSPIPAEYLNTHLRSVTLIYRDGTEVSTELENGIAIGKTKMSDSGEYDLMDIYAAVDFTVPMPLEGLSAVRINDSEISIEVK